MLKNILCFMLVVFSSSAMAIPFSICKTNAASGLKECTYYGITAPSTTGVYELSTTYSALVPAGETRPIHITHAVINQPGPVTGTTNHVLLVESPAGSGAWQIPLCWLKESQGTCKDSFDTGIMLSSGDELCLNSYPASGAIPPSVSYAIYYTVGP